MAVFFLVLHDEASNKEAARDKNRRYVRREYLPITLFKRISPAIIVARRRGFAQMPANGDSHPRHAVHHDEHNHDGARSRHIERIGNKQPANRAEYTHHNACRHNAVETRSEKFGYHLRHSDKRHEQHNSDKSDCEHDAKSHQHSHQAVDCGNRGVLCAHKVAVESAGDNSVIQERHGGDEHNRIDCKCRDVGRCDCEDIAKEERSEFGHISRREEYEKRADRHSERPHHSDSGVFADFAARRHQFHAESRSHGKNGGHRNRVHAEEVTEPQPAEAGVGYSPRDKHHSSSHDVGAHNRRSEAHEKYADNGVLKKCIFKNIHAKILQSHKDRENLCDFDSKNVK